MYRPIFIFYLFSSLGLSAFAGENQTVTLHSVAAKVRASNPQLAAARLRIAEARGRVTGAGRLANPTLELEAKHDTEFREGALGIGFAQSFPVTDRLRLEKAVSIAEVRVAEAEVAEVERQLVAQARTAVVEVLASRDLKIMRREEAKLAEELAKTIESAAKKGEGSFLDAGQAKLGSIQHALKIRQLDVRSAGAIGTLKTLLGTDPKTQLDVTGHLPVPYVPKSKKVSASNRPDYRAAVLGTEAAQREVALEKSKRREDIEVGLFAEIERTEDAPEGLENDGIFGVRVSIPLPLWNKNEGAIEEAQAKQARMVKQAEAVENEIQNEVEAARSLMAAHAQIVADIDRDLLPLAKKQVELSERAYREGQGDLQAVLRARDQQIELQTARLDGLREFHLEKAAYEAAAGK